MKSKFDKEFKYSFIIIRREGLSVIKYLIGINYIFFFTKHNQ